MTLKFTPQFQSITDYLKGKDTTPEMYARLHNIQVASVWSCLGWHRQKYDEAGSYCGRYNGLMSNPRLRQWLKREQDYTEDEREADRHRQNLIDGAKRPDSRTKRQASVKAKRGDYPSHKRSIVTRSKELLEGRSA